MEIATASLALRPVAASVDSVANAAKPDALAAARFSELMRVDTVAAPVTVQPAIELVPPNTAIQTPVAPAQNVSIGDRILSGMQGLSGDMQQSWSTVKNALENSSNMTTADMLKLQMGLTQMSIQYDLVGKAISRSTQNLDQLLKMQ